MATITELLKNKEYHRLSAILFALQTQAGIDNKNFEQYRSMRCWNCLDIMNGEIAAIKKRMDEIEKGLSESGPAVPIQKKEVKENEILEKQQD